MSAPLMSAAMDPLMPMVFSFLDYQSLMSAARVCRHFRALAHSVEGTAYERAMLAATCAQLGRRLQTTAYVDALEDVSDDERQVAFNQGFAMATGPTFTLSYYRGLLLCVFCPIKHGCSFSILLHLLS